MIFKGGNNEAMILTKLSLKKAILHGENWGTWFKIMCPTKWPQFEIRMKECELWVIEIDI